VRLGEFVEQRRQLIDELVWFEPYVAGKPGADGLPDAADHEVRRGLDAVVCRYPQRVADVLSGQHGEHSGGFGAFARDHRVGQLGAEQQAPDPGVAGDGPHDVGHSRAGLLVGGHRRHGGLRGGG